LRSVRSLSQHFFGESGTFIAEHLALTNLGILGALGFMFFSLP